MSLRDAICDSCGKKLAVGDDVWADRTTLGLLCLTCYYGMQAESLRERAS